MSGDMIRRGQELKKEVALRRLVSRCEACLPDDAGKGQALAGDNRFCLSSCHKHD